MKSNSLTKVTFYKVKDNLAKIQLICTKAEEAYKVEKRLLITVPNFQAAQYVETLLWKLPADSFLPHVVSDTPTSEWIAITMQEVHNVNLADRLLNLCPTVLPLSTQVIEIFELYDESSPEKTKFSEKRMRDYQLRGVTVKLE